MNRYENRKTNRHPEQQKFEIVRVPIIAEKTDIRQVMREKNKEGLVYLRTEATEILFKKYVQQ